MVRLAGLSSNALELEKTKTKTNEMPKITYQFDLNVFLRLQVTAVFVQCGRRFLRVDVVQETVTRQTQQQEAVHVAVERDERTPETCEIDRAEDHVVEQRAPRTDPTENRFVPASRVRSARVTR